MEIKFYRKNVYGKELMYVAPEQDAMYAIYALTHRNTISHLDMESLTSLGCTFVEVLAPKAA